MNYKSVLNIVFTVTIALAFASVSSGQSADDLVYGKYGCTSRSGSSYTMRGSFTITSAGKYTYYGFEQPSSGTFAVDGEGNLKFTGGYLDAGVATKIDRPNKFFLVFPTIPDNRWTCGLVDK